jgi:TonB family protein
MRTTATLLVTLTLIPPLCAGAARAQQPSSPDTPLAQAAPPASDQAAPSPDANGVYPAVPGIESPYLTSPAMAALPADADTSRPRIVRFTVVIGADGSIGKLSLLNPQGDALETAAATAIQQSKFAPGTLNGNPVPVQVCVSVPFIRVRPPIPHLQACIDPNGPNRPHLPPGTTPPRATYTPVPEYSEQARKKKIQGTVLLSTLVNEQGQPTDIRIERSLGYGLDENAVQAVSRYRFSPAIDRDGHPVAVRIRIEVSFQLY